MEQHRLDVLIASNPANVTYISDFWNDARALTYAILPFEKYIEPTIVLSMGNLDYYVNTECWFKDVKVYGTFFPPIERSKGRLTGPEAKLGELLSKAKLERDATSALVEVLKEKGFAQSRIGLDEKNITPVQFQKIKKNLPKAEIIWASDIFREIRIVKSLEEIKRLKRATEIVDRAYKGVLGIIEEGKTEKDLGTKLMLEMVNMGGIPSSWHFGGGTRSAMPNLMPLTDYALKKGDVVRFDGGCIYQFYYSDIARTAVLGRASEKIKKYYSALQEGQRKELENIRPGVKASTIYNIGIKAIRESGIPHFTRHQLGHGIGLELHVYDPPIIGPHDNTILEDGMVINVEPNYYELGSFGLALEDTILITKDGYELMTSGLGELYIL